MRKHGGRSRYRLAFRHRRPPLALSVFLLQPQFPAPLAERPPRDVSAPSAAPPCTALPAALVVRFSHRGRGFATDAAPRSELRRAAWPSRAQPRRPAPLADLAASC